MNTFAVGMVFSGHTSLSFAGNSYIKYRLSENSKEEDFKLALRLRTLQSNGIIMYTRANPCMILKVRKNSFMLLQLCLVVICIIVKTTSNLKHTSRLILSML